MRHLGLAVFLMLSGTVGAARADVPLAVLAGDWRGTGEMTTRSDGPRERGRCRVQARRDESANSLTIQGRCAVAAGSGTMTLRIVDDGNGQIRAGFRSPQFDGVAQLAGAIDGNALLLESLAPFDLNGVMLKIRTEVVFETDGSFLIREWNAPVGRTQWRLVTEMTFIKAEGT